jgi:2-(1,2-epoxy-1,2-dihydrophenyl)acetyl-CoA isomerase
METFETLNLEIKDNVAWITLNRPDNANGMNMQMGKDILDAAKRCEADMSLRCVVLTGSGAMFSAGGDLKAFSGYGDDLPRALIELTDYLHAAVEIFAVMNPPLIVAVNGAAAGAGFSIALCGDIVIAADTASFTMAYTALGFSPDGSASYYLPRLIGLRKTQELMLTNRKVSAEEALDWGMVTQVAPADELHSTVEKLASRFASGPTQAFGTVKRLLHGTWDNSLHKQLDLEANGISDLSASEDGKEGLQAFLEKRKPDFNG